MREPIPVLYLNGTRLLISLCWPQKAEARAGVGPKGERYSDFDLEIHWPEKYARS